MIERGEYRDGRCAAGPTASGTTPWDRARPCGPRCGDDVERTPVASATLISKRSTAPDPTSNTDLPNDLRGVVRGEVRFDRGSRALYATDGSNYRQVPIGVVVPRDLDDVVAAVEVCRKHGAPILSRGGGTSLAGQCCNVAVVIDVSKYVNRVLSIDAERRIARVEPGVVLDTLQHEAAHHGLIFGPDPATHDHCTLGGMLGNNSCGVHAVMSQFYGPGSRTSDNTHRLEILTYDGLRMWVGPTSEEELRNITAAGDRRGHIYTALVTLRDTYGDLIRQRYPKIPRRVSGYNLDELLPERGFNVARALVGTESTCVTILQADLMLIDRPQARSLLVLGYPDVYSAADHVPEILEFQPIGLEGMDDRLIDDMKKARIHPENVSLLPDGKGWLLVEFGGNTKAESDAKATAAIAALKKKPDAPTMKLYDDPTTEERLWKVRESGLGATAHVPNAPVTWEGWEDSAVPPDRVGDYLRDLRRLFDQYEYGCALYGHFGQGCIHTRIDFDLESAAGIEKYKSFMDEATSLVVSYGGSFSGEHGDGQSKAQFLPKMFGPELVNAFREFKTIWDPDGRMNPGKIVDPYRIDQNLRLGAHYRPADPATHFVFPQDHRSFAFTTIRCVGVGECRRHEGGTMCPSYRATREEAHSTRGRARLLFEMLQGNPLNGGWKDEHVKKALDLCLACKGCKGECPVNVDMATYKAEFLSHYYEGRLRPRSAYAMGFIHRWARLASHMPHVANLVTQTSGLSSLAKVFAGISQRRTLPRFADRTFVAWFQSRRRPSPTGDEGQRVLLWPDTFNNHFHPDTAIAATEVLEAAGCHVIIPARSLCCGRPLYDYGFLVQAKRLLREILDELRPHLDAGTPIVVLEPSCLAVFRDELVNLFPDDRDAQRLSRKSFLLAEVLRKHAPSYKPSPLSAPVLLHGHCHHKAIATLDDEESLLRDMTADVDAIDSGCCGMAGSFGFEANHYDVSMQVGDLVLLPTVRKAPPDTLIVADGFSCREQIEQGTGRRAVHIAQALHAATVGRRRTHAVPVEDGILAPRASASLPREFAAALVVVGLAAVGFAMRRGWWNT
jgi:FAD/FMN-containing dehydrogenase/Fe-S oxidoreductase